MEVPEKTKRRYRYKDDIEAQACVAAASEAWWEAFLSNVSRYYHISGTDVMLRVRPRRSGA